MRRNEKPPATAIASGSEDDQPGGKINSENTTDTARSQRGRRSRNKGARIEREIVELHRALGIHAERVPLSGASHYKGAGHDVDVLAFGPDSAPLCGEVKARKNGQGFATISRWVGDNDFLILKQNHADPIVVVPWRVWALLLREGRN
jgi:hypothetical protein